MMEAIDEATCRAYPRQCVDDDGKDDSGAAVEHFDASAAGADPGPSTAQALPETRGPFPGTGDFSALTALPQPEPLVDVLAGPAWARTWAEAIVCYWETEHACGAIDPAEPLYLIDLAPGRGALASLLLTAIESGLRGSTLAPAALRYVACCDDDAALERLRTNSRLAPRFAAGSFAAVRWRAGEAAPSCIERATRTPARTANPIVTLAAGAFRSCGAALCAAHCGQWLRGDVERSQPGRDATDGAYELAYAWQPVASTALGERWVPLVERYRENLVSAPVTIPTDAAAWLDALRHLSGDRCLLLCCDMGVTSERAIRDGVLAVPETWHPGVSLMPVNFHALHWHQRASWVYQREQDEYRLVLHAAWSRAGVAPPSYAQCAMRRILDAWAPLAPVHLARAASALVESEPCVTPLALLRSSSCDPRVLRALVSSWPDGLPQLDAESIPAWREALEATWDHHVPPGSPVMSDTRFELALAAFAIALGDWGLAKEILRTILPLTDDALGVRRYLAHSLAQSGGLEEALVEIEHARVLAPDDTWCQAAHEQLTQRAQRRRSLPWYRHELARDGDLTLEPLGVEHARAFLACYSDPHIAAMVNLPALRGIDETVAWIEADAAEAGRTSCAIVDARYGFVGVASLSSAHGAGYFYFWLGSEAQGRGIGTRAARRLFALAEASGIDSFFTAAYSSNGRSMRALARLGFRRLPVRSEEAPDAVFLYRAARGSDAGPSRLRDVVARLGQLWGTVDAPATFVLTSSDGDF